MASSCFTELTALPAGGRWMWDETKKSIVYQSGKGIDSEQRFDGDQRLKMDLRTGRIQYRKQSWPVQQLIKTKENSTITVDDVIQAALNVMSEMFYIPIEFEEYVRTPEVREFLLYLLNYFFWFLDMMNNAIPKVNRQMYTESAVQLVSYVMLSLSDRSEAEKQRIRLAYAHLLVALDELTCKYAVLLLGVNLKNFHHMRSGDLFYSCADMDRTTFESLLILSTYFTWIAFYRQQFEIIRRELARLFRADGDMEMLRMPLSESLEGRMKNNLARDPMTRHRLIDCSEFFSTIEAKRKVQASTSDTHQQKASLVRSNSVRWTLRDTIPDQATGTSTRQRRWQSLLARDVQRPDDLDANDDLYASELHGRSPYYRQRHQRAITQRQNRMRGILTRQLKSRNHSLIEEQLLTNTKEKMSIRLFDREELGEKIRQRQKTNQQRHAMQRLLSRTASVPNRTILPAPSNPLDDHRLYVLNASTVFAMLPEVQFKLNEKIGIIGKPYSEFEMTRLTLKPSFEDHIQIPAEFLVTLPDSL